MPLAPKAVLFDIDGTLMTSGGAGREAMAQAAARLTALPVEQTRALATTLDFRGATDTWLFTRYAELVDEALSTAALRVAYLEALPTCLATARVAVLPGVVELVRTLEVRTATRVGLMTGNFREGARGKLARVGLEHLVERPGGFGEDGAERRAVASAAIVRMESLGIKPWATLFIGDTPLDVEAAHAVGAPVVAVGTGWHEHAELEAARPELLVRDLSDPGPVLALLGRL